MLVDVREPNEYEIDPIPGAVLIPKGEFLNGTALEQLPQDKQIVLHCKTGVRSAEALAVVKGAGFADAVHVGGGVVGLGQPDRPEPAVVLTSRSVRLTVRRPSRPEPRNLRRVGLFRGSPLLALRSRADSASRRALAAHLNHRSMRNPVRGSAS